MRHITIPLLVAATATGYLRPADPARGAEANAATPIPSTLTEVTVYADRAQVTRTASVQPATEAARLAFASLPGWLDEGSIRVSLSPPNAGQILDVQVERTYLSRPTDEEFQKAEAAVQEISDQLAALDDEKTVLETQSKQIETIRMFSLEKLPKDMALREIQPEEYGRAVEFIGGSLLKIAKAKRELEKQRRELQPELNARQRKLDELRQRAQLESRTVVVTLKGSGQPATLLLTYLLPGATWKPVHELRTTTDARRLSLASYAVVMQTTGEDWTGVKLALSTQRTTETLRIPELEALTVGGRRLPQLFTPDRDTFQEAAKNWGEQNEFWFDVNNSDAAFQQEFRRNRALQLDNVKRVQRVFETVLQRGTTAHFPALGAQVIRTDGRLVRVPIGQAELPAQERILAAPELSLNAARIVETTNTTPQPLLPGRVSLFVGGAFLGLTETGFVAPGEDFTLYLGMADGIKLSRALDHKRSSLKRGGTKTRMQVSFLVTVENLAGQPTSLQLTDRVPVSEAEDVRISGVKVQPDGKPDEKGLLRWDLSLAPKESREFRIEYTLEYPTQLLQQEEAPGKTTSSPGQSMGLRQQIKSLERKF